MLELTPSALGKMPERRLGGMWTRNGRAIRLHEIAGGREGYVAAALGHPLPARCYADDVLRHKHSDSATGRCVMRSSAISPMPANSPARPCSHTPAHAASNAPWPCARIAVMIPARTSPVPALPIHGVAGEAMAAPTHNGRPCCRGRV